MESSIRTYRVADFCFTVENLPNEPKNMQPFRVDEVCAEKIFSLKIVTQLPDCDCKLFYRTPDMPGFPVIVLYTAGTGYLFDFQPLPGKAVSGRMMTDADFCNAQLALSGTYDLYTINRAMMLLFSMSTACRGALEMHSSVVTNGGRGFMFLGKSGTGKSTHSQLWLNTFPGTELLNDDNPVVRLLADGTVRVYGSPWSGKTPCYKAKDAPVGAIVHLQQAPYNKMVKQPVIQAYVSLMESSSSFRPIKELADGWHRTMEGICATVPFYKLECLPDRDAALLCYNTVNGKQDPA